MTGAITANGSVTAKGDFVRQGSATSIRYALQNTALTKGTSPDSSYNWDFAFVDSEGLNNVNRAGSINIRLLDGDVRAALCAYKWQHGATNSAMLAVTYKADGTIESYAPTPAADADSSEIVTAGWANDRYLRLSGGTVTGNLTVNGTSNLKAVTATSLYLTSSGVIEYPGNTSNSVPNWGFSINNLAKGDAPDKSISARYYLYDKDNPTQAVGALAGLILGINTDGGTYIRLCAFPNVKGSSSSGNLGINAKTDGTIYTEAPTPPADDSSTKIATTRWVKNCGFSTQDWVLSQLSSSIEESVDRVGGRDEPTLTALIDWDAMKSENGGTDVRNINNSTYGIKAYGGDSGGTLGQGDIILKQSYESFDALLVEYTNDSGSFRHSNLIPMWQFKRDMNTKGGTSLVRGNYSNQWDIRGRNMATSPSTTTRLEIWPDGQDCGIIEIYGVTY